MSDSFYDVLGVSPDASTEEMEDAFREKVLETHPDKNDDDDSAEQFKRVKEAKQVLTNPKERQQYDRLGHEAYVKQSGSESLWGIRSSGSSGGTEDRTTRQRSSSTASRQSSSRSSGRSTTGGGSRGNERTRQGKRQGSKQKRGQKRRGGGQKRGKKRRGGSQKRGRKRERERGEQRRGRKRGEQRRRKRQGRQRNREGTHRKQRQQQNRRQRQQGNQRTRQQQNQRTQQRKKQTGSKRERARRQQSGQRRTESPRQAGGQPRQQGSLFAPGLGTVAVSSLGLTAVWVVGRGVLGLLFTFVRAGLSFEVFADTLEFGALAVFSFFLISSFSSALNVEKLTLGHYVVIFGTWMLALPVLRVMPFRIDTFATFVFTYAFIGGASIVVLATIVTIENQS